MVRGRRRGLNADEVQLLSVHARFPGGEAAITELARMLQRPDRDIAGTYRSLSKALARKLSKTMAQRYSDAGILCERRQGGVLVLRREVISAIDSLDWTSERDPRTYIFAWNPIRLPRSNSEWVDDAHADAACNWSIGGTMRIRPGDRVFLFRQGGFEHERGLFASGDVCSTAYYDRHWNDRRTKALYVDFSYDHLALDDQLSLASLEANIPGFNWRTILSSGRSLLPESAVDLESLWTEHIGRRQPLEPRNAQSEVRSVAELIARDEKLFEGKLCQGWGNRYERNAAARRIALERYGLRCSACDVLIEEIYGELGRGYIHVHHVAELASRGERHEVDPVRDLRPVCPNCHAMLHQQRPALSVQSLRAIVQRERSRRESASTPR